MNNSWAMVTILKDASVFDFILNLRRKSAVKSKK